MNNRLPSTKSLQVFLITAKQLNLTRAAERLNITQGAVSRQIQMLEDLLGVQLFYRKARGLKLTAQGEKFIPHAEDIVTRLRKAVVGMSSQSEIIKLNAPSCITPWILPNLMKFQENYPEVKVELTSTVTHFVTPDFDVFDATIVYGKVPKSPYLEANLLFEEQLSPVCISGLLETGDPNKLDDKIDQFTWLHANTEQTDWKAWLTHRGYKGSLSKRNQHFPTLDHAMNAALQGFGIVIGDIKLAERDIKAKRLLRLYDDTVSSGMSYFFVHPKNGQHPLLARLLDQLLSE